MSRRQTFVEVTQRLVKQFQQETDIDDRTMIQTLVSVEMILWVYQKVLPGDPAENAWSMLPGYDEVFPEQDMSMVHRLRILFPHLQHRIKWRETLEQYRKIRPSYRLFCFKDGGRYGEASPVCVEERMEYYRDILMHPISEKIIKYSYLAPGDTFSYRDPQYNEKFEGKIPDGYEVQGDDVTLPAYRKKVAITEPSEEEWVAIARKLDELQPERRWVGQAEALRMQSLASGKTNVYKGASHIVGGLGAGKTTFVTLETWRLVHKHQAKIGIIAENVQRALDTKRELESLGLQAEVIVGTSNRLGHTTEFLHARANDVSSFADWDKYEKELKTLSYDCTIHSLSKNTTLAFSQDTGTAFPCNRLYVINREENHKEHRHLCPLYRECGVQYPFRRLKAADVWIATSQSVIHTRIPEMIDPYRRPVLKAMYDLLDVIFVDEADSIQAVFDREFVEEINLFGKDYLFQTLKGQAERFIESDYRHSENPLVRDWCEKLANTNGYLHHLYYLINNKSNIRSYLKNNIVYVYYLIGVIVRQLLKNEKDEAEKERLFDILRDYAMQPIVQPEQIDQPHVRIVLHMEEMLRNNRDFDDVIWTILDILDVDLSHIHRKETQSLLLNQLKCLLLLSRIDYNLRFIFYHYPMISYIVGFREQAERILHIENQFRSFMKDSMTGKLLGYQLLEDEDGVIRFKVIHYAGVGRDLLTHWHRLYEDADDRPGPCVLFLSGTSYAPGNRRFHLELHPDWILQADRKRPKVDVYDGKKYVDGEEMPLAISGVSEDKKAENLHRLMLALEMDIERELERLQAEGRKILMVVNSYDQSQLVAEALEQSFPEDVRFLVRDEKDYHSKGYPRSLVERFHEEEARILVAPAMSIARGYNILKPRSAGGSATSLFGTVFFLIRMYPVPNDLRQMIQILHSYLPTFIQEIQSQKRWGAEGMMAITRQSTELLRQMILMPDFWAVLTEEEREVLAWYSLTIVWQVIGRLLRGGSNARVYFVDGKYFERIKKKDRTIPSMIDTWRHIFKQRRSAGDRVFEELYGPIIEGILNIHSFEKENQVT